MECGDCGYTIIGLNLRKAPIIERGYNCTMYQKYGRKSCSNHSIKEEKVLFFFKELLKDVKNEYEQYINSISNVENKNNIEKALNKYQRDLSVAKEELKLILAQKIKELVKASNDEYRDIIQNAYIELEAERKKRVLELSQKVSELKSLNNEDIKKNIKSNIEVFDIIINSEIPKREHLEMILDKIIIYSDRSVEFKLKVNIDKLAYFNI